MSNCWSVSAQAQQKLVFQCIRIELNWAVEEEGDGGGVVMNNSSLNIFSEVGYSWVFFKKQKHDVLKCYFRKDEYLLMLFGYVYRNFFFSLIKDQFSKGKNCCIKMHNDLYSYISLNLIPFEGGKKWRERRNVSFF